MSNHSTWRRAFMVSSDTERGAPDLPVHQMLHDRQRFVFQGAKLEMERPLTSQLFVGCPNNAWDTDLIGKVPCHVTVVRDPRANDGEHACIGQVAKPFSELVLGSAGQPVGRRGKNRHVLSERRCG